MKRNIYNYFGTLIPVFLLYSTSWAQEGIANFTDIEMHGAGSLGIHTNFENHASFVNAEGLTGFYGGTGSIKVSGSQIPYFFDVEFASDQGVRLELPVEIENNANLIRGDLLTSRQELNGYPLFNFDSFYTGESNSSKVDGFVRVHNKSSFVFPVGRAGKLRVVEIESDAINAEITCAYFYENPALYSGFLTRDTPRPFDNRSTLETTTGLRVSGLEFWFLDAALPSRVKLTWDEISNVSSLAQFLDDLRVVGKNKATGQWEDLGNTEISGGKDKGWIISETFLPQDYAIITLGGTRETEAYTTVNLDNYYISPNSDGVNENLKLDLTTEYRNNSIQIYDRNGLMVYKKDQYQGEFVGIANVDMTYRRNSGLESGIYFYIITFHDLREKHHGYLYLTD
ncbi:gliding motility-associated C-terminal domain-containing protein [Robiginitalea myxolifaciens]|uniref:Gliding motility-associated C-terminal domain-containing protein n=1 Tax=Robiginitalea myxolifaciens TaxID=400055 RepID=A0A1I6FPY8_9FLAO|nr:gliding motility-associated C-terminal domain-containing protein [Robiginitalea myxolifaciens]SFR32005.1 gliding motility-associated C-terminal domain-containing protein [Robiginitalea myxolifaciens]